MFSHKKSFFGLHFFAHKEDEPSWSGWEKSLCFILIFVKICALLKSWNVGSGFDWKPYVDRVALPLQQAIFPEITSFYGYHPPFAFLVAKIPMLIGFTPLQGVQLLSFFSSLATFFLLRATLKHMEWLNQPAPIAFLYISSAIPLQVYLSTSATMDSVLLPLAAGILYVSMMLFSPQKGAQLTPHMRHEIGLYLIVSSTLALLTKFSGLLLLCIPPLVGFFMPVKIKFRARMNNVAFGALAGIVAITIVFPYYFQRYYQTSGKFFPSNNDYIHSQNLHQAAYRLLRDEAGLQFFSDMFLPTEFDILQHPEWRDMKKPRLIEAWKDVWRRDIWLGKTSATTRSFTIWYLRFMPWLVGGGFALFILRAFKQRESTWLLFGFVLFTFSLIEIIALIKFTYDYPRPGAVVFKACYIAPAMWILSYCLSQYLAEPHILLGNTRLSRMIQAIGLLFVGSFIVLNYLLPVY